MNSGSLLKFRAGRLTDAVVGLLVTALVLAGYMVQAGFLESLESRLYDARARMRKAAAPSPEVLIVAIDDPSIARIGRWPWPRWVLGDLIKQIQAGGASVIGVNIPLAEEGRSAGLDIVQQLRAMCQQEAVKGDKKVVKALERVIQYLEVAEVALDHDARLAAAIRGAGNVVLPVLFAPGPPTGKGEEEPSAVLSASSLVFSAGPSWTGHAPTLPLQLFANDALSVGHVNVEADPDGVVRRAIPLVRYGDTAVPAFAVQLLRKHLNLSAADVTVAPGVEIQMGRARLPLDGGAGVLLDFAGPAGSLPRVSAVDVLGGKVPVEQIRGRIVLIGHTATGLADLRVVPVGGHVPSVELFATLISDALTQSFIIRPAWARPAELAALAVCGLYLIVLLPSLTAGWGALGGGLLVAATAAVGWWAFLANGWWLKATYPLVLILGGYLVIVSKRLLLTEQEKDRVERAAADTNRTLGLTFQGQGMLDLAFEKFRLCPLDDSMKDILYNLGLDYERKRQFNKAVAVYEMIAARDLQFKDLRTRIPDIARAAEAAGSGAPVQKTTLGPYRIMRELGKGAAGIVYLAQDGEGRSIALKTLRPAADLDEPSAQRLRERFARESKVAGVLDHPNIVKIFGAGEEDGTSWIAMEYLEGESLAANADPANLLPIPAVVEIVAQVADALGYAHANGVVHRDVKPANLMRLKDGTIRVTDFGMARIADTTLTVAGTVLGTPYYMSPEQVAGKPAEPRSDLYSLGVVLFELLAGRKPFTADALGPLLLAIVNQPPPDLRSLRPDVPGPVVAIVERALQKSPDARYQTAADLSSALRAAGGMK